MDSPASSYQPIAPSRTDIDRLEGPTLIEFGTAWCGHCRAAQPLIAAALAGHPTLRHLKVEDGKGRLLGRSFRVKLWPTLILVEAGRETGRVVRPRGVDEIRRLLAQNGNSAPTP
jgi:thioredoxin 1